MSHNVGALELSSIWKRVSHAAITMQLDTHSMNRCYIESPQIQRVHDWLNCGKYWNEELECGHTKSVSDLLIDVLRRSECSNERTVLALREHARYRLCLVKRKI